MVSICFMSMHADGRCKERCWVLWLISLLARGQALKGRYTQTNEAEALRSGRGCAHQGLRQCCAGITRQRKKAAATITLPQPQP